MSKNTSILVIAEVHNERERQKTVEGWTLAHDDEHDEGEMALAAACYASPEGLYIYRFGYQQAWPWDNEWFKRKSRRHDLVRAAALIVAEIERLDRTARATTHNFAEVEAMAWKIYDHENTLAGNSKATPWPERSDEEKRPFRILARSALDLKDHTP